ncbi:GNAT family N-acetyltransferase [Caproiciproducens sp. LBM24188]|nr:GNAT family N-acetyltransferase [Clostridiales bacterium]
MKKLTNNDRYSLLDYIRKEPEMNLFIFGDIENFGLESDQVEVLVQEGPNGWNFILLRYLDSYILYSQNEDYNVRAAADYLSSRKVNVISGKTELLNRLLPYFPDRHGQETYMARLNKVNYVPELPDSVELRRLTADNATEIVQLYSQIAEFRDSYIGREAEAIEEIRFNLSSNAGRSWGVFRNGKLTAVASSSAENSVCAMIVGVATLPGSRKMGLASGLVAKLCTELLESGKEFLCLFYDNPEAGSIYRKIGFKEIGSYMMIKKENSEGSDA